MTIKFVETKDGKKIFDPKVALSHAYLLPWYTTKEIVAIKGAKGSGKSFFAALWLVVNIMNNPHASALVIRKIFDTISGSCYQDIKNALYKSFYQELVLLPVTMAGCAAIMGIIPITKLPVMNAISSWRAFRNWRQARSTIWKI